jgi:hypothetical protein
MVYLILSGLLIWRLIALTSVQYFFTHDMLVISKGVIFKTAECRALWQLKGIEVRNNRLLGSLGISHINCGQEGPPADRIRIIGVDNATMTKVFDQLNEAIDIHLEIWRKHFQTAKA